MLGLPRGERDMKIIKEGTPTEKDNELLLWCARLATEAMEAGNHPFAALLADQEGRVLLSQGNRFSEGGSVMHAETLLVFEAVKRYSAEFLSTCTLYTSVEPCAMCTGALYWSGITRLVFGLCERDLLAMTGANEENPTFDLSSVEVLSRGQREIEVYGPTDDEALRQRIAADHRSYWSR